MDVRRQCITYLESLSKWITERGLGKNDKKTKFIKSCKGQEIVESHDRPRPEGTQYIKKGGLPFCNVCSNHILHGNNNADNIITLDNYRDYFIFAAAFQINY